MSEQIPEDIPELTPIQRAARVSNSENTPNAQVLHAHDPDDGTKSISLCGADWSPASSFGSDAVICFRCVEIAEARGLVK